MESESQIPSQGRSVTLQQINKRNEEFWAIESELLYERSSDPILLAEALEMLRSEITRGVSVSSQKSLGKALADAERARKFFHSSFSQRGGAAPKMDALQGLIQQILLREPNITEGRLLRELKLRKGKGIVISIEEKCQVLAGERRKIHYEDFDGTPKAASVSGLKDRLSRIKRKMASR